MPDCENAIDAFTVVLVDAMRRGEPISIQGMGTFSVVTRNGRIPFNKMAGELAGKPYRTKRVLFKAGLYLKAAAKGGKDYRETVLSQMVK
jgi:nucleoid DNA-binding protein